MTEETTGKTAKNLSGRVVRELLLTAYAELLAGILEREGDAAAEVWLHLTACGMGIRVEFLARMIDDQLMSAHPELRRTRLLSDD